MATDEDDDAEDGPLGAPLPPDDRLWRHPSEMSAEAGKQQIVLVSKGGISLTRTIVVALFAGLVGAATTLAVVAGTDAFVRREKEPAISEREVPSADPKQSEIATAAPVFPAIARVEVQHNDDRQPTSVGSAVAFRSDGMFITTAELVDNAVAGGIKLFLYEQEQNPVDAQLVGRSPEADIAVLKIDRVVTPARLYQHPLDLEKTLLIDPAAQVGGPRVSVGVITQPSTEVIVDERIIYGLIQVTTAPTVTPRSPGSVLIDEGGSVIGIVTRRTDPATGPETTTTADALVGTGPQATAAPRTDNPKHYAADASWAWNVADQLTQKNQVVRADLGLYGRPLRESEAKSIGRDGGIYIEWVAADGPAGRAQLKPGDIIVNVERDDVYCPRAADPKQVESGCGRILSNNDLVVALRHHRAGDAVAITFVRGEDLSSKYVTLTGKPEKQ